MRTQEAQQAAANQIIAEQSRAGAQMYMALKAVQADLMKSDGILSADVELLVHAAILLAEGKTVS